MFQATGILAQLLIVLFSAVRVGKGCQLLVKWKDTTLLAAETASTCHYFQTEFIRPHYVTYFPPNDAHGPPRVAYKLSTPDLTHKLRDLFAEVHEKNGVIVKQMDFIRRTKSKLDGPKEGAISLLHTREEAISRLRSMLKIQCTLLFESPVSPKQSSWFLIVDVSMACSDFLAKDHLTPRRGDHITTSITFDAGDKTEGRLLRSVIPQDLVDIYNGLGELQLIRDEWDPNKDVIRYRTVPALSDVRKFLDLPVSTVKPSDLSTHEGQVQVEVDIFYEGQSKTHKFSFVALLAEWDEKWTVQNFHHVGIQGVDDLIFQKTPLELQFTRCDLEEDRTCKNPRLLEIPTEKPQYWFDVIRKLFDEEKIWRANVLYLPKKANRWQSPQPKKSFIYISVVFLESLEGANAWVKSLLWLWRTSYLHLSKGPYENEKSGSRSRSRNASKAGGSDTVSPRKGTSNRSPSRRKSSSISPTTVTPRKGIVNRIPVDGEDFTATTER